MSMYWMINGNPDESTINIVDRWMNWGQSVTDFPRFRDVTISERKPRIEVYTRTGGGNREEYEDDNIACTKLEGYVKDYDDDYDSTYANFVYDIPKSAHETWSKYVKDLENDRIPYYLFDKWFKTKSPILDKFGLVDLVISEDTPQVRISVRGSNHADLSSLPGFVEKKADTEHIMMYLFDIPDTDAWKQHVEDRKK